MLWKKDRLTHRFSVDETELHQLVRSQSNSVAKRARARDGLELTLAALVGFVFFYEGALDLGASEPSLKWEWIVLAFGC